MEHTENDRAPLFSATVCKSCHRIGAWSFSDSREVTRLADDNPFCMDWKEFQCLMKCECGHTMELRTRRRKFKYE